MPQLEVLENNFTIRCQLLDPLEVLLCYHIENPRTVVDVITMAATGEVTFDENIWSIPGLTVGHLTAFITAWHTQQERHKVL